MELSTLAQVILSLLVGALILYLATWVIGMAKLPQPARNIILAIVATVILLWILTTFGVI